MTRPDDPISLPPPGDGTLGHVALGDLTLVTGVVLPGVTLAVQRWGRIARDGSNVVLIEHALTGDTHVSGPVDSLHPTPGWWNGLLGPGLPLDTDRWYVVCSNVLGGCQGTTGPSSTNPATGEPYGLDFPLLAMSDFVTVHRRLGEHLGIEHWAAAVGGSLGGMQVLQWALDHPGDLDNAVVIAALLADDFDGPVDGVGRILGVDFDGLVDDAEAASTEELGEQVPPIELEAEEARHEIGGGGRHGCSGKKMCRRCVDTNELQARGEKGCKVEEMRRTGERLKVVHLERRKDGMGDSGAWLDFYTRLGSPSGDHRKSWKRASALGEVERGAPLRAG